MELEKHIRIDDEAAKSPNLCSRFADIDLKRIGAAVVEGYLLDIESRRPWMDRSEAGMNLAMQMVEERSFPWANSANVAFPLVTIAALQFHSRSYPALINGSQIVKYRTIGPDVSGDETQRAYRIGSHMSYQCLEEDEGWEEGHDRLLINVPIVGCCFTKCDYNDSLGHNVTSVVMARDLVIDYFAKSVETAHRVTQIIPKYKNEIWEKVKLGAYRDILDEPWYKEGGTAHVPDVGENTQEQEARAGLVRPERGEAAAPFELLEQHVHFDLDGDGYEEPYIITVDRDSSCVLRIVAGWHRPEDVHRLPDKTIIKIDKLCSYTKYELIPSPDGGIYGMGFGILLGPLNEAVNSLINQMLDAGTLQNTAGGFLGRGAKIRSGTYTFSPFEWKRLDSTGDDIKKSIFPLPVNAPSSVLFQLLGLLIDYTNRISGATEMLAGQNPGQNTPAANGDHMVEQGLKIYAAIFKRMWRAMKQEFRKLYVLNGIYIEDSRIPGGMARRADYLGDPRRVCPVADPNIISDSMRMQQAMLLAQRAASVPGYDIKKVELFILQSSRIDGVEQYYPGPEKTGPLPNAKAEAEKAKSQGRMAELSMKIKAEAMRTSIEMMEEHALNEAKIVQLEASAENLVAQAKGIDTGHLVALIDAEVGQTRARNELLLGRMKSFTDLVRLGHDIHSNERTVPDVGAESSDAAAQGASAGAGA